ncbi:MAG: hypothetical protein LBM96_05760 [Methanobrevibacter sp.]|jgi:polyhydroxyalkanoate synthesis regulator phasin|nr:hypothetical protein [Candidatus Methanoflexus mossambicus]
MEIAINIIIPLITAIIGGFGGIYFAKEKKTSMEVTALKEALDSYREYVKDVEKTNKATNQLNIKYQAKISEMYQKLTSMQQQIDVLKIDVAELTNLRCDVIGCENRKPPRIINK